MSRNGKHSEQEDNEIILGILNDSSETLRRLYLVNFPTILQFILNNNGDEEDAKDVFQEAVIVLYNKVKSGNFELQSKLKTFLYSVCRRLWLKRLQQQKKYSFDLRGLEDTVPVEQDIERHEERDLKFRNMEAALEQIGEPCKTILEDFYLFSRSMQEICDKFGYTSTDNAKNQKYKCLQRLKKLYFKA